MDTKLKLQHEAETCVALAAAVSAMLCEMIDDGGTSIGKLQQTICVLGLFQDKLDTVKALADSAVMLGM